MSARTVVLTEVSKSATPAAQRIRQTTVLPPLGTVNVDDPEDCPLIATVVRRLDQADPPGASQETDLPGDNTPVNVGNGGAGAPLTGCVDSSVPFGGRAQPSGVVPGPVIVD